MTRWGRCRNAKSSRPRNITKDVASGGKAVQPRLTEALDYLRAGDTLLVWRLDRLGRSLSHLIELDVGNNPMIRERFNTIESALAA